jgi:hypothetical protein
MVRPSRDMVAYLDSLDDRIRMNAMFALTGAGSE